MQRIYLDNAATSWPKPEAVYEAVDYYQRELGATTGRGAYREADEVERRVALARQRLVELLGVTGAAADCLHGQRHRVAEPGHSRYLAPR